jgi:hypothetical protein
MMKKYLSPEAELVVISTTDVITFSGEDTYTGDHTGNATFWGAEE